MIKGLEHLSHEERLRELKPFSLGEKEAHQSCQCVPEGYLKRRCNEDGARLFSMVPSARTSGNTHKIEENTFHPGSTSVLCR